jgi:hypothetical protein
MDRAFGIGPQALYPRRRSMNRKLRKLSLSRETLRHLSEREARTVAGGITDTNCPRACSIDTCHSECTCTQCSNCCP